MGFNIQSVVLCGTVFVLTASCSRFQSPKPIREVFRDHNSYFKDESDVESAWWNNWPRATFNSDLTGATNTNANMIVAVDGGADEGRGPLFRERGLADYKNEYPKMTQAGVYKLAWIEGMGETRSIIGAIEKKSDGSFSWDSEFDAALEISNNWSWDFTGPGKDARANTIVWYGLPSFYDNESWLGKFRQSIYNPGLQSPTYPDGSSATGMKGGGTDPRASRLYDALAAKDIFGIQPFNPNTAGTNAQGKIPWNIGGRIQPIGDFSIGKDMANPWWLSYTRDAVHALLARGLDGFWVDNYTGFDSFGSNPIRIAFGDWSVTEFRTFLRAHPELNLNPNLDVRAELKNQFKSYFGVAPASVDDGRWGDSRWQQNDLWKAYVRYRSELMGQRAQQLYQIVKEEAASLGRSPSSVYVGGNDIPILSFAAIKGEELDMINTEYSPDWNLDVGSIGRGLPPNGHTGPFYSLANRFSKSRHSIVWYYLDGANEIYLGRPNLGELLGYEALAHNTFLNAGDGSARTAGNDVSQKVLNQVIQAFSRDFGYRKQSGQIGLYYSTETQLSLMTPEGATQNTNPDSSSLLTNSLEHIQGYYGWGAALEDSQLTYRAVPDFRLSAEELEGLSVLILPHVRTISQTQIDQVLKPFLTRGGQLLITGLESGRFTSKEENFKDTGIARLAELAKDPKYKDNVTLVAINTAFRLQIARQNKDTNMVGTLTAVMLKAAIQSLSNAGVGRDVVLEKANSALRVTRHDDYKNGARFFDFVNMNFNLATDRWTDMPAHDLTLSLPSAKFGVTPNLRLLKADSLSTEALSLTRLDPQLVRIKLPPFKKYLSLMVEPVPNTLPPAELNFLAKLEAAAGRSSGLNFDEWNYFYSQMTGENGPAPEDVGLDPAFRGAPLKIMEWFEFVRSKIKIPGDEPPLKTSVRNAAGNPSTLNFDEWNYFYEKVTGIPGQDPAAVGLDPARRADPLTLDAWWGYMVKAGFIKP